MTLTRLTATDFRCFRELDARLAPLTILLGENSTGKTSFLALVRALMVASYRSEVPNFRQAPYDLGGFANLAHSRGARGGSATAFSASFEANQSGHEPTTSHGFEITFRERNGLPVPVRRRFFSTAVSLDENRMESGNTRFSVETPEGRRDYGLGKRMRISGTEERLFDPIIFAWALAEAATNGESASSEKTAARHSREFETLARSFAAGRRHGVPYCSAPIRTVPQRTYDPYPAENDPEGAGIPTYLANLLQGDPARSKRLVGQLRSFGADAGLFDEFRIDRLKRREGSGPFQIQVRRHSGKKKGPWRNLVDMGYGVSQALPILTELLRPEAAPLALLQQPEVHLHPSAQAAFGSLLCRLTGPRRQVVVETHSDYLWDRVRMDIRDGKARLDPEQVSVLFFERGDLDVRVHSIRLDGNGNVIGTPPTYREFFENEVQRSIWAG